MRMNLDKEKKKKKEKKKAVRYDEQLPHDEQAEAVVLSSIFLNPNIITNIVSSLKVDDFFTQKYRLIFEAINKLYNSNKPIEIGEIRDYLVKNDKFEQVGEDTISQIVASTNFFHNIDTYVHIIREKSVYRDIITKNSIIMEHSFQQKDIGEILDEIIKNFNDVTKFSIDKKKEDNLGKKVVDFKNEVVEKLIEGTYENTFIPTQYELLDEKLGGGFLPGNFILIGARASKGKTTFALNIMKQMALEGKKILFFSLEQPAFQIIGRYLSMTLEIPFSKIMKNDLSVLEEKFPGADIGKILNTAMDTVLKYAENIYIVDDSNMKIDEIKNITRKYKIDYDIDAVFIDYLQFIKPKKNMESRLREITQISGELKEIARETNTAVVSLSQLSRSIEKYDRKDKAPKLSDLRDSGALEQDADIVMFLWDEVKEGEEVDKNASIANVNLSLEKNRNGETGLVKYEFFKYKFLFEELS